MLLAHTEKKYLLGNCLTARLQNGSSFAAMAISTIRRASVGGPNETRAIASSRVLDGKHENGAASRVSATLTCLPRHRNAKRFTSVNPGISGYHSGSRSRD
ncbi:PREDICTED: uncharacterized protein LOC106745832 isoform X2 [Dinoponera quadriceps]|uniref:Uncharacterized protein LOC106745832 isoform X2 n=1 Tax=Dinoponera quadriceps TaxID=609295 RepID=A0A6P3XGT0_DINQU|nr:PREDICTED: uncharacterized protein LOC106745832 isoform X2 [Dinoponera quadriceps]